MIFLQYSLGVPPALTLLPGAILYILLTSVNVPVTVGIVTEGMDKVNLSCKTKVAVHNAGLRFSHRPHAANGRQSG